jgi:hypothetical protein
MAMPMHIYTRVRFITFYSIPKRPNAYHLGQHLCRVDVRFIIFPWHQRNPQSN